MWIKINKDTPLPLESGTKAVVYMGITAWFYWNKDDKRWHPIHGWRRIVGYPFTDMEAYMELPEYKGV